MADCQQFSNSLSGNDGGKKVKVNKMKKEKPFGDPPIIPSVDRFEVFIHIFSYD